MGYAARHSAGGTAVDTPGYKGAHRAGRQPSYFETRATPAPAAEEPPAPEWPGHALIEQNICPGHPDQPADECAAGCTWFLPGREDQ